MLDEPSTEHGHLEHPARHKDTQEMGESKEESTEQASEAAITLLLPSKHPGKLPYPSQMSPSQQLRHPSHIRPRAKIARFTLHAPTCSARKQTTPNWDGFAPHLLLQHPLPAAAAGGARERPCPPPRERDPRQTKPRGARAASATEPTPLKQHPSSPPNFSIIHATTS